MTGLDLSVDEELSSSFEPCLNVSTIGTRVSSLTSVLMRTLFTKVTFAAGYTHLVVHSLNDGIAVVSLLLLESGDQEAQLRGQARRKELAPIRLANAAGAATASRSGKTKGVGNSV